MTELNTTARALKAIAEGYPVHGKDDRYVVVQNPAFREDDGSDQNIVVDIFAVFLAPAPMTEDRRTFVIPEGYEAVRDAEGRATGEVRPALPAPASDLVERLREGRTAGTSLRWQVTDIHREAADALAAYAVEIERLTKDRDRIEHNRDMWKGQVERQSAELASLREWKARAMEVIEPFAKAAHALDSEPWNDSDEHWIIAGLTVGHLRAARALATEGKGE